METTTKKFFINSEEFANNYRQFAVDLQKGLIKLREKPVKSGFKPIYLSWTDGVLWIKEKYPDHLFKIDEITNTYIKGSLYINDNLLAQTVLTFEQYADTKQKEEQLVGRVYVKLIAIATGYGLALWNEPENFKTYLDKNKTTREW